MIAFVPAQAAGPGGPCSGPMALLSLLDRPTVADSACVARPGDLVIEAGYKHQTSPDPSFSRSVTYPNSLLRLGLPKNWEIDFFSPNYNRQTTAGSSGTGSGTQTGLGDVTVGAKYEFGQVGPFVLATDFKIKVPSGARPFSTGATDVTVNGIFSYSLPHHFGLGGQLGISALSSRLPNGQIQRYVILLPDLVLTYHLSIPLQFYGELYRASTFSTGQSTYSLDGGLLYLIRPWWEVDAEADKLLQGPTDLRSHYFGLGTAFRF